MNMFARFDENPAMTLQVIKETKRYGRTDGRTDGQTHGQRENSIPPTNKICGGYKNIPVRERTSFKTVNFHKQRAITLESLMRYGPLSNLKKTLWYLTM